MNAIEKPIAEVSETQKKYIIPISHVGVINFSL